MKIETLPGDALDLIVLIAEKQRPRLPSLYDALHDAMTGEQMRRQRQRRGMPCYPVMIDLSRIADAEAALFEALIARDTMLAMEMDKGAAFFHEVADLLHATLYSVRH